MSKVYVCCTECAHKFYTESVRKFSCPNCGIVYIQMYDKESHMPTWVVEEKK